jgi:phosphoserine phosphatase
MVDASLEAALGQGERIVAIDVCGTLFDVNTSAGLAIHHHKRLGNRARSLLLKLITGQKKPLGFACVLFAKITKFDLHRAITFLSLRGQNHNDLVVSAKSYLEVLEEHRIDEVHDRIQKFKDVGWYPVLVSNSIDLIVEPIAHRLGLPYLSSRLGWSNSQCTGFLVADLTGKKLSSLESFLGFSIAQDHLCVITDNKSDADLINRSSAPLIVAIGKPRSWMESYNAEILHIKRK